MPEYPKYSVENMVSGWTRIDMLLALYDRAIASIRFAQAASMGADHATLARQTFEANKYLLALHSGLNTECDPVASDVARLLNFVMLRLEERNFDESVYFLEKLRSSFDQIREEATALEKSGKIPPLNTDRGLNTVA